MLSYLFAARLAVEIIRFIGIGLEIVELPLFRVDEVVDQLVAFGAYAAAWTNVFEAGILVELIEPVLAPVRIWLALGEGQDALALHVGRNRQAGDLEQRRSHVEVERHVVAACAWLHLA